MLERDFSTIYAERKLRQDFTRAMAQANADEFIPKPKSLSPITAARRVSVDSLRAEAQISKERVDQRFNSFAQVLPSLEASELATKSLLLEQRLKSNGAIYGDRSFNFALSPYKIDKEALQTVETIALTGFRTLVDCTPISSPFPTPISAYLEKQGSVPNGARVDIILTSDGPKIIEINTQWIDAIQALQGFQIAFLGKARKPSPLEILTKVLAPKPLTRLGIINLSSAKGSRSQGSQLELDQLATNLSRSSNVTEVEVLDPRKTRLEYLDNFNSYYLNGDPKMLGNRLVPDWLELIYSKKQADALVFPLWQPALDSKRVLVEASTRFSGFAATRQFSDQTNQTNQVLKGEGFSSSAIFIPENSDWSDGLAMATDNPQAFVFQDRMQSIFQPQAWCFDTSSQKPRLLKKPQAKFNVWIIGDQLAGTLVSLSDSSIISDKDFNTIPIP